jgi:hypothetical protein
MTRPQDQSPEASQQQENGTIKQTRTLFERKDEKAREIDQCRVIFSGHVRKTSDCKRGVKMRGGVNARNVAEGNREKSTSAEKGQRKRQTCCTNVNQRLKN